MSYLDTRQALLTQLLAAPLTDVAASDIAVENENFDPSGKSIWLTAHVIPATSEMMGKTTSDKDERRGIFQVTVRVPLNGGDYDTIQLRAVDEILSGFQYNSSTVYNTKQVDILNSTVNAGIDDGAWFKRDISINYLTFSSRG